MAAIAKTKYLGSPPDHRPRRSTKSETLWTVSPDYVAFALILALMFAMMALAMWLASFGGGAAESSDYWMLMP